VAPGLVDELDRYDNRYIKLRGDATAGAVREALIATKQAFGDDLAGVQAPVSEDALKQLKFAELLPPALATATLAARAADADGCRAVARSHVVAG
jgi:ATP-dependent Lhr-like helicase